MKLLGRLAVSIAAVLMVSTLATTGAFAAQSPAPEGPRDPRHFAIPLLDSRGYLLDHFEVERWFLERINYHREAHYGVHPYRVYIPARITAIEHSLDMRDNEFGRNMSSDGRTHQERHDRWIGPDRTKVTSSHSSTHIVADGRLTREGVNAIVDHILLNEVTYSFLMNPTYDYIGIGFAIQQDGIGRLNITMASPPGERAAHRARTRDEIAAHRQATLERVRAERGWVPPAA